jgi:Tfp pilus assembly protein PilO
MNTTLTARGKVILSLILFIFLCIIGYYGYLNLHSKPITAESQQQAETPAGISLAAHNAKVSMMQDQLDEAAQQIAALKNKPPDTVIQTVPYEVEKVVIKEVEKRGADFAIVTDPKEPDKKVDLKEIAKLPENTPVTLNQYNVLAYKKIIRGINVYPSFTGIKPSGVSEVTYDVSRKVTNDGKYIGVVGGYNFEDKKVKVGLRITF